MTICDKIQNVGDTLETNLNNRGVSCTFGTGSGESTILDMANLITSSNLKGSADSLISITANRPYLLSGETTDLTVRLVNGLGQPLANKSVSISDGSSLYRGITNSDGLFVLYGIEVSDNTTFTATYSTVSATCNVYLCEFVDYGVSSKYTAWDTLNMTLTRSDAYTLINATDSTSFASAYITIPSTATVIEADVCFAVSNLTGTFFSIRSGSTSLVGVSPSSLGLSNNTWGHMKLVIDGTTLNIYCDGTLETTRTLSSSSYNRFQASINANITSECRFKNLVVY